MRIGILKEFLPERRVALLPEACSILIKLKTEIWIEKDAGIAAFAGNAEYEKAEAKIVSREELLKGAEVITGINAPLNPDISLLKSGMVLIAAMNISNSPDLLKAFMDSGCTAFSLELIPRTTRGQSMDILSSMSTISGYKAVLEAALRMPRFFPMFMSAAGTIKPAKVLILGAGVAGLQAVATSRKLGAMVEVFDVRSAVKEEVLSLGAKFIEVEGAKEDASAGGYAIEQTEEFKRKQAQAIHDHATKSDVVICTAQIPGRQAPVLLKKETVEAMRPGSVIVDLAASTGGNCELTKNGEILLFNQISIIGKSDYPSDTSSDASKMFGNNLINFLKLLIDKEGKLSLDFNDEIIKSTCACHLGNIVSERLKK
jgi:H+-translocating NAD(P) transhydrogenase subunit alpha